MKRILKFIIALAVLGSTRSYAQDSNFYVFLCLGQSNMVGVARATHEDSLAVNDRYWRMGALNDVDRKFGEWQPAYPPLCRRFAHMSPADFFARTLLEKLPENVKIGMINVAVDGTASDLFHRELRQAYVDKTFAGKEDWLKNEMKLYDLNPLQRLIELGRLAQKRGVIKGILWHQGETDAYNDQWLSKVKFIYHDLLDSLNLKAEDCPLLAGEVVSKEMKGICAGANATIDRIHDSIPTAYAISSYGCPAGPDNLHFAHKGVEILGRRYGIKWLQLNGYDVEDDTQNAIAVSGLAQQEDFKVEIKMNKGKVQLVSELPVDEIDVVSYSGKTIGHLKMAGKKKMKFAVKQYGDKRLVLVIKSDTKKVSRQIEF